MDALPELLLFQQKRCHFQLAIEEQCIHSRSEHITETNSSTKNEITTTRLYCDRQDLRMKDPH